MQDKLQEILNKIKAWWGNFTTKQKTIIIAITAVVVLAVVILVTVLTRPQYVLLANCETTKEASEITALLDSNDITYTTSADGLEIKVLAKQESQANLLLGANDILAAGYGIDNVTNGGISTTEADKQKRYVVYLEDKLENDMIKMFSAVKSAHVMLHLPDNDGTLHTCQITDKISGTQWRFKAVLHRKGQEVPNKLKTAGNENITITGAGRYIIVDDMTDGKRYKVKL